MRGILHFLNPVEWIRACRYASGARKYDKSSYDLELFLYSKILTNNMLHFGYFDDTDVAPDTISLKQIEEAQVRYAEKIIGYTGAPGSLALDVGCGLGGLAAMISDRNQNVECLTPNRNQIAFINKTYPGLITHKTKFEEFDSELRYDTIINSESLQYIDLDKAFEKVNKLLAAGGRWIIVDFFRLDTRGINKSSHLLDDLHRKIAGYGFKLVVEEDITQNVLPTLKFAHMYVERLLLPVKHYAFEKLRYKRPKLYYMTKRFREQIDAKIIKETASLDPDMFCNEKRYMFFVLEKVR